MGHNYYAIKNTDFEKLSARLLSITLAKDEQDWQSSFHTHSFTEIFYVINGKGSFLFRNETHAIKAGNLIIIPPYLEHTEQSVPEYPLQYYVLSIDGISFLSGDMNTRTHIFCDFSSEPFITALFSQILTEVKNGSDSSETICQKLLEILILKITQNKKIRPVPSTSSHMTKECAQIKEYLDANYAEHITLDSLTRLTHMNKYYMAHSFTKYTGLSPIQYLNERRLETACYLLEKTDHSISEIASLTGFSSQSYFTQNFRKKYQTTPIRYRQEAAKASKSK